MPDELKCPAPPDPLCICCGHRKSEHVGGLGRCSNQSRYGGVCLCWRYRSKKSKQDK